MRAVPPSTEPDDAPVEAFLFEQLEAIADELFARLYRPRQQLWKSSLCPWCRRLAEIGMTHVACPICSQINRSRKANRAEQRRREHGETAVFVERKRRPRKEAA